jgi:hypothetical protein
MTGVRCKKSGRNSGRRLIVGANEHEALNTSMKPLSMDETKLGEAAAKAMRAQDLLHLSLARHRNRRRRHAREAVSRDQHRRQGARPSRLDRRGRQARAGRIE